MNIITVYSESIDPPNSTSIVTTVPVGSRPHSIDFGLGKVFVTNSGSNSVSIIDGKTDRVEATIPVGANPHGIAAAYNDDEDSNNALDSNLLLKFPYTYVANTDSNTVSVIDGKTDRVEATIPVGSQPHGIIVSNTLGKVYVSNSGSNSVSVIDGKTNEVIASIPVGSNPKGLCQMFQNGTSAVTAAATTIYVINTASNSISTIPWQRQQLELNYEDIVTQGTCLLASVELKLELAASVNEYITQTIPFEFNKALTGISLVIRDSFKISEAAATDPKTKLDALRLVIEAYEKRMELLSDSSIIDKVATHINIMKTKLENIQEQEQQQKETANDNDNQSSIDYGYDAKTTVQKVEEMRRLGFMNPNFDESKNAKFGPGPDQ